MAIFALLPKDFVRTIILIMLLHHLKPLIHLLKVIVGVQLMEVGDEEEDFLMGAKSILMVFP